MDAWKGDIGISYTKRCDMSIERRNHSTLELINQTLSESFGKLFDDITDVSRVLEVGSGLGYNMKILSQFGNYRIYGVEPQRYAIQKGKEKFPEYRVTEGDVFICHSGIVPLTWFLRGWCLYIFTPVTFQRP